MEAVWFAIVSAMLAVYAVLDGFDLRRRRRPPPRRPDRRGAADRAGGDRPGLGRQRGLADRRGRRAVHGVPEGLRHRVQRLLHGPDDRALAADPARRGDRVPLAPGHPLWREFWDTVFSLASVLLAVVFGATLGNLVRGVPLGKEGLPGMPLFTNFLPGREPGILDWYTGLVGLFTLAALAGHGALYLAWRTAGPVRERSLAFARRAWKAVLVLWVAATAATAWVRPEAFSNLVARPWALAFVALSVAGICGAFRFPGRGREPRGVPLLLRVPARDGGHGAGGQLPVLAAVDARPLVQPHRLQRRLGPLRDGRGAGLVGRRDRPGRRLLHLPVPLDAGKGRGGPVGRLLTLRGHE